MDRIKESLFGIIQNKIPNSIVGIIISIWIFITAIKLFKESYDVLMDKCISEESKEKVLDIIK